MRVLVVEDHARLADSVARVLRREGMAVDVAYDGTTALDRTVEVDYDVVVLDRDLPGVPGDEVCRRLMSEPVRTRVLMLTAAAAGTTCSGRRAASARPRLRREPLNEGHLYQVDGRRTLIDDALELAAPVNRGALGPAVAGA